MKTSELLLKAADLIEPEGRWTAGALAKTRAGNPIGFDLPNAYCFCALGAIQRIARYEHKIERDFGFTVMAAGDFVHHIIETAFEDDRSLVSWNDDPQRKQSEVVAALRQAAELAKQKEAGA